MFDEQALEKSTAKSGLNHRALKRVISHIEENYHVEIPLAELASVAFLSTYHFSRLFKQSTGLTPHQYVISYRVRKAVEMMGNGHLNMKEIARQVGFCDQSHMTRHFKRIMGSSPVQYFKQNSGQKDSEGFSGWGS